MLTVGCEREGFGRWLRGRGRDPARDVATLDALARFLAERGVEDLRLVTRGHLDAFARTNRRHAAAARRFLEYLVATCKLFANPAAAATNVIVPITSRPSHAISLQPPPTRDGLRFRDFARRYRETVWAVQMKPSSLRDYDSLLARHLLPYFGERPLRTVGAEQVAAFAARLKEEGLSNKRTNNALIAVKTLLRAAQEWGYIEKSVRVRMLPRDVEQREMAPLAESEVARLLGAVDRSYRTLFLTAFVGGMRWGELLALRWDDVDFEKGAIWVRRAWSAKKLSTTKTRRQRRVEMQAALARALRDHARRGPWIFSTDDGAPLDLDNLRTRAWTPALRRAGLPYRAMINTRHTYASLMLQKGNPLAYVSAQLGHATPHTTLTYYTKYIPQQSAITPIDVGKTNGAATRSEARARAAPLRRAASRRSR